MKIVHLCSMDYGGAGKAAHRLHKGLVQLGLQSTLAVLSKKSRDATVKVVPESLGASNRFLEPLEFDSTVMPKQWGRWNAALEKAWGTTEHQVEAFTDASSPVRLDLIDELKQCDVVNLHWVAGMFDYFLGSRWLRGKPVVWTLHDMNPFTGGCHFAGGCDKFKAQCGACPLLRSGSVDDASRATHSDKRFFFTRIPTTIVAPSRWLGQQAQMSTLLRSRPVRVIPYGCDPTIFRPQPKAALREGLRLPPKARLLLCGADYRSRRKGFDLLLNAVDAEGSVRTHPHVYLGVFGVVADDLLARYKSKLINFGRVDSEEALARLYGAADAMLIASVEDNLPNTAIESILCGTPVVGFPIGGMPDIIDDPALGTLVPARDVAALAGALRAVLTRPEDPAAAERCRRLAVAKYELRHQAERYASLYRALLVQSAAPADLPSSQVPPPGVAL